MSNWIFPSLPILIGLLMFKSFLTTRRRIAASQLWVKTSGRITDLQLERKEGRRSRLPRWRLRMQFEYPAGSKMHSGNEKNIALSDSRHFFHSEEEARKVTDHWQARKPFYVFYNPANPEQCALEIEEPAAATKTAVIAFGFFTLGIAMLLTANWKFFKTYLEWF